MTFLDAAARRATVFDVGGFRPPSGRGHSWYGRVDSAAVGEAWPVNPQGLLSTG